ncbi:MAG: hypothetical protein A2458_04990 [Candidatus Kerfeldbacteria bacterium RIFOXYC2_FULL_38_9]|nr:MAG: hypothetical protein A2458_04990 [Candidatus Kerfeldbacteria bacterium RIFOXYC2_FULL_38_9]
MNINPHIFREYDIRGIVDQDLTPALAWEIGRAFGTLVIKRLHGKTVAIGCDVRQSSPTLKESCITSLRQAGCDVVDIGTTLTPMMYFSCVYYKFDAALNITGSHNPKDQNGFKFAAFPFRSIYGDDIQALAEIIQKQKYTSGQGTLTKKEVARDYLRETKARLQITKPLNLVMDSGNGTAGLYAPGLYRQLGCLVDELYCQVDNTFPHHLPNPQETENMEDLRKRVLAIKADLGIAFDGDGDRVGMVDHRGNFYDGDLLMLPLIDMALRKHPGAAIVVDVKSSQVVLNHVRQKGGKPILGRTGPPNHKANMEKYHAPLAGEVAGHYFITDNHWGFDDGLFAGGRILQALEISRKTLFTYFQDVPKMFATPEIKISCADEKKFKIVEKITQYFQKKYECATIDGVRVNFSPTAWGLVRASNTTPNLTLRFEGKTPAERDSAQQQTMAILNQFLDDQKK